MSMPMVKIDFEEIKEESLNKWKAIRLNLNAIIATMESKCSFCEEYHDGSLAPECPLCPAQKACIYALETIVPETRKLRDKVTALIGRIKRVKQKEK